MPNIVLLQPRIGDMDQFRDCPTPPMGLLGAAAALPADVEVRLIDQRLEPDWRTRVRDAVDAGTLAAGVSTLTGGMIGHALAMAAEVRGLRDVPIVWGGVHPSLLPGQTAQHDLVDYVVQGEGEVAFAALAEALRGGRREVAIPGVWAQRDAQVHHTPRQGLADLSALPMPAYGAVDMERYIGRFRGRRMFSYQSSRGCPHRCRYCYNLVYNERRWRALPADRVLSEIAALRRRYDFDTVYLLDDNFFVDKARALRILEGLRDQGVGSILQGVDVDSLVRLSDAELDFLETAGVERISVGVEAGADRVREGLLDKWGDVATMKAQLARLRGRRLGVLCSIVVGFPGEARAEVERSVELALWILRLGENFRMPVLYNYVPFPGTPLFEDLAAGGFPFPDRLEGWARYEWENVVISTHAPDLRDYLDRVTFVSRFLDRKTDDFGMERPLMRLAYSLYRPVAWARLTRGWLGAMPERRLYRAVRDWLA